MGQIIAQCSGSKACVIRVWIYQRLVGQKELSKTRPPLSTPVRMELISWPATVASIAMDDLYSLMGTCTLEGFMTIDGTGVTRLECSSPSPRRIDGIHVRSSTEVAITLDWTACCVFVAPWVLLGC